MQLAGSGIGKSCTRFSSAVKLLLASGLQLCRLLSQQSLSFHLQLQKTSLVAYFRALLSQLAAGSRRAARDAGLA